MKKEARADTTLLISDLHLDPARPGLTRAFFDFLDTTARGAGALYILGDFFNVWLGDDDDAPLCTEVSHTLKQLAASGTSIFLMHGNRDFLMGHGWASACGATLIDEPHVLRSGAAQFLLMHGDALCTRDADYMAFRSMVRKAEWQRDFLARPLAERRAFAEQARAKSKTMSSNKPADIMDVTPAEVDRVLDESNIRTLIHGHTHRPAVHALPGGRSRIVLGDWDAHGWCLRIDDGEALLEQFAI